MPHYPELCRLFESLNLTGELNRNTPESNRQAIRELIARNDYWTFGADGFERLGLEYDTVARQVAAHLGINDTRFAGDEVPYIDPRLTVEGLASGLEQVAAVARRGGRIVLATAHPGSLLGFYAELVPYLRDQGATIVVPDAPIPAHNNHWLDAVAGVMVLSNEGDLNHTHGDMGMRAVLESLAPDFVIADHGFAIAAVNARIPVLAIFDVDDPAIVVAADAFADRVWAVPMNDNQTNTRSAIAARALVAALDGHHA